LWKTIYPLSATGVTQLEENLTYDKLGNVKKRIDTANRETLYEYDTANRLIKTTDANLQQTLFEYNARSQMTKVTDALSQQYVFTYDPLGRQLTQTRAGTTMSFLYDAVGNRTKRTDYMGRETSYEYDVLNRLKKINYLLANEGGPDKPPMHTASYNYDDLSRLVSAINEAGTVSFTYDTRNRPKTTTDVFGHAVEYGYDANGNRTQLKLDGGVHTTYAYDVANRLTTLTDEASQNFTFGYDIANKLISKALPNGISSTFDYDGMSRLTRLKNQSSSATLTDNQYAYSPANQINQIAELSQTRNLTYDNIDRLTGMTNGTTSESYSFDAVGNRNSSHRSSTYSYQPFNKLTSTATASYTYDPNGNMVSKGEGSNFWRYGWDYENRMTLAATRRQTARYIYDALGRRVRRFIVGGKESTKFIYDGLDVVMDDDVNTGITKYQNGLGIDNKLKMVTNGNAKYFLQDHLGSTVGLTDPSGAAVSSASYDSFGNSTNNLTTRYQYTGREFDNFSGLQFSRARWYDPAIGRFISQDPIGFNGDDINLYGYVWNNPFSFRDPLGLQGVSANQPASWSRTHEQQRHIDMGLEQPQFQRPENLSPGTSDSWWSSFTATLWDRAKACFGDIPTGKLPTGGFKAGAPGMGEAINILEHGPQYYDTFDRMGRWKHDQKDVLRCIETGTCGSSDYKTFDESPYNRPYEDLSLSEKGNCIFWGNCPPSRNNSPR
jgi:RHS repeat-associated protein